MATPEFLPALGTVDGTNISFSTPTPYIPNTLTVFLNGQLLDKSLSNGWAEVSPILGTFTLAVAPVLNDIIQVFYLTISTGTPDHEVLRIEGRLSEVTYMKAEVEPLLEMKGVISIPS